MQPLPARARPAVRRHPQGQALQRDRALRQGGDDGHPGPHGRRVGQGDHLGRGHGLRTSCWPPAWTSCTMDSAAPGPARRRRQVPHRHAGVHQGVVSGSSAIVAYCRLSLRESSVVPRIARRHYSGLDGATMTDKPKRRWYQYSLRTLLGVFLSLQHWRLAGSAGRSNGSGMNATRRRNWRRWGRRSDTIRRAILRRTVAVEMVRRRPGSDRRSSQDAGHRRRPQTPGKTDRASRGIAGWDAGDRFRVGAPRRV